ENTWDKADSLVPTMPSKLTFSDKSPCKIAVYFAVYFKDRKRAALSIKGFGCQFGSLCRSHTQYSVIILKKPSSNHRRQNENQTPNPDCSYKKAFIDQCCSLAFL